MATGSESIEFESIGTVRSTRKSKRDDEWGEVESRIQIDGAQFDQSALRGLDEFSHLEVIFFMHRVPEENIEWGSRHPRNNANWPEVGIFAQRAKGRPNRIGLSRCQLRDVNGLTVFVNGLDAIDGSLVLGLKPYMKEFGPRGDVFQPSWASELMEHYYE